MNTKFLHFGIATQGSNSFERASFGPLHTAYTVNKIIISSLVFHSLRQFFFPLFQSLIGRIKIWFCMDAKFVVSLKAMIRSVRVSNDLALSSLIIGTIDNYISNFSVWVIIDIQRPISSMFNYGNAFILYVIPRW